MSQFEISVTTGSLYDPPLCPFPHLWLATILATFPHNPHFLLPAASTFTSN